MQVEQANARHRGRARQINEGQVSLCPSKVIHDQFRHLTRVFFVDQMAAVRQKDTIDAGCLPCDFNGCLRRHGAVVLRRDQPAVDPAGDPGGDTESGGASELESFAADAVAVQEPSASTPARWWP